MGRVRKQRFEFESLSLQPAAEESQYRQIENQIRDAIKKGLLAAGARVPSSRKLALALGVSRNTVLAAYDQLISEGYLETEAGSGTRVSQLPPEGFEFQVARRSSAASFAVENRLSTTGRAYAKSAKWLPDFASVAKPFRPHLPAIDEFPVAVWNRFLADAARWSSRHLDLSEPQGYRPLREAIAEYMAISRGVSCGADEIVVTSGAQQSLHLVAQVLLETGDTVWMEEPGNMPGGELLEVTGHRVVPIPLDGDGVDLTQAPRDGIDPKLIYVTPGGQWPMGMAMSLNRRLQLLAEASRRKSWVLEDDYNGEFRYAGRPYPALSSLDRDGRTIYMGSFSKLLFPAIRLGFLVVPRPFVSAFTYGRWLSDRYSSPLTQMTLHRFIESGHFLKHIRQMRALYRERQSALYELLREMFSEEILVEKPESGMHLVAMGRTKSVDKKLITSAERAGVEFHAVSFYARQPESARGLILGFAAFEENEMRKSLGAWSAAYRAMAKGG